MQGFVFNSKVVSLLLSCSGDGQIAKLSRSKPLFPSTGKVVEISDGSVERFSALLQKNKISFVLIYAPWCGQSLAIAHEFNRAAKILYKEVHIKQIKNLGKGYSFIKISIYYSCQFL